MATRSVCNLGFGIQSTPFGAIVIRLLGAQKPRFRTSAPADVGAKPCKCTGHKGILHRQRRGWLLRGMQGILRRQGRGCRVTTERVAGEPFESLGRAAVTGLPIDLDSPPN